jgi:hypothetical protein
MKAWDKYKTNLPYPSKSEFTTTYYYRRGELIAKKLGDATAVYEPNCMTVALDQCVTEKVVDEAAFKKARNEYGTEERRLQEEFEKDLYEDLGIVGHPKASRLYGMAWEDGHANGYSEVYSRAAVLVDLIKD